MTDLTEGQRLYAIGDVHGRRDLLDDMLARIRADLGRRPHPRPRVVMLGDYVDRGPDTRGVIDALIALRASDLPTTFMLGNHDSYVEEYLNRPEWHDRTYHWLHPAMGGAATLASYGVLGASEFAATRSRDAFAAALPDAHRAFLLDCKLWHRVGGYVFVHAGLRPGVALESQRRDDCIWIREPFLSSSADFGFKVVHGHTIVERVEHRANRIAIDTGVAKNGPLSCLVLEDDDVALLEPDELRPWPQGSGLRSDGLKSSLRRGLDSLWPAR